MNSLLISIEENAQVHVVHCSGLVLKMLEKKWILKTKKKEDFCCFFSVPYKE